MSSQPQDLLFGAYNSSTVDADTSLFVTLLDPITDKERVDELLALGDLQQRIDAGKLTLYGPADVALETAYGPQRGFVKDPYGIPEDEDPSRVPLDVLGPTDRDVTDALVAKAGPAGRFQTLSGPLGISLKSTEVQQVALRLMEAKPQAAYLVVIEHFVDAERKEPIGDFCYLFTT